MPGPAAVVESAGDGPDGPPACDDRLSKASPARPPMTELEKVPVGRPAARRGRDALYVLGRGPTAPARHGVHTDGPRCG